jgi:short-subunit dehydrogenase
MAKNFQGKTALVTGASAGIGLEFARQLAAMGCDLVLTARRQDRLQQIATELTLQFNIKTHVIALDLADPGAPDGLEAQLQARQVQIDILINNAGFGLPGTLVSQPWSAHAASLQVLLTAPTQLCHALVPAMRERGWGRIINVASLAGLVPPSASHTTYGAIKSYLIRFSQSLALEEAKTGVAVLALCPGFTYSEFHDANGARSRVQALPKFMWMDAATVVRQALVALEAGKRVYVNGGINQFIALLCKYLPDAIASWLVNRNAAKFREPNGASDVSKG